MKAFIVSLTCLTLLLCPRSRADDVPFFNSLREEIVDQVTLVSNTVPQDKKLLASLRSSLKVVEKSKPTLSAGSTALGTLAKSLGGSSLSNVFLPLIIDTREIYIDTMQTNLSALEERLGVTIPGKTQSSARIALAKFSAAFDGVFTNASLTLSLKSLSKAAQELSKAEMAVVKAENAQAGTDFLSASITESGQGTTLFKPVEATILTAHYDAFSGEIEIDAGELKRLGGPAVQIRFLELTAAIPGSGTHTLSLTNGAYAIYQRSIVPDIRVPEEEIQETYLTINPFNQTLGAGTMTITVDLEANIVWGNFTFTANGNADTNLTASMTGDFLLRLENLDEEFE